jgi:hypothetical protein
MGHDHNLQQNEKKELLRIARETLTQYLDTTTMPKLAVQSEALKEPRGAFVTLKTKNDILRGCIGTFFASKPLYLTVQEMAISAATKDPRFPPLTDRELPHVVIEISALSRLQTARPEDIEVGTHGVFITRGFASGVLLPQVPVEQNWDRTTFLQHVCLKAGLPPDAYRWPDAKLEVFTAQVFSERTISAG